MTQDGNTASDVRGGQPTRAVLFGMRCNFTGPVLSTLATAPGLDLQAVVLPESISSLPQVSPDPVLPTIRAHRIPLIGLPDRSGLVGEELRATLGQMAPDAIVVACFPWRLPDSVLSIPRYGCLNVHPSLLPDGHGPEPVFWAFRWGLTETGVTLHLMDSGWDTGPVLAQRRMPISGDATVITLEQSLAQLGAALLVEQLAAAGPNRPVAASLPDIGATRHARFPRPEDILVSTSWLARDAARFIGAVLPVYGAIPILVLATGQRLAVDEVIGIRDDDRTAEPAVASGDKASIRFTGGTLICRLATMRQPLRLHLPGS